MSGQQHPPGADLPRIAGRIGLPSLPLRALLLLPILGVGFAAGCDDAAEDHPPVAAPIGVTTIVVRPQSVERVYRVPGSVVSDDRVQLSSRISGFIQTISVREGDRVKVGEVLVEIDPADVEGNIGRAQAMLQSAQADLMDAKKDVNKFSELAAQGGIPADTLRKAQVRAVVAESRVAEATAALDTATAQKRYSRIVSPVAGVVTQRNLQPGDLATPGLPILVVESQQSLVFQTFVAENRVSSLEVEQQVQVRLDTLTTPLAGSVLRIVPSGDPVTRRYEVKLLLPARAGLFPGMFGRAEFVLGEEETIVVERSALVHAGGLTGVYVLQDEPVGAHAGQRQIAAFRWLRTRREWDDRLEVTAGLAAGDRLIANPPEQLTDGAPVLPQNHDTP